MLSAFRCVYALRACIYIESLDRLQTDETRECFAGKWIKIWAFHRIKAWGYLQPPKSLLSVTAE